MTVNVAKLPERERREIELSKRASLLINNLKHKKISRSDIHQEIEALDQSDREVFKDFLNKYREGSQ